MFQDYVHEYTRFLKKCVYFMLYGQIQAKAPAIIHKAL